MVLILGLDVSTAVTGLCVINDAHGDVVLIDRIDLKKCKSMWEKADMVARVFANVRGQMQITHVAVEEALMGFRPGMSSATTISALLRFNGIVSYVARDIFGIDPQYIGSAHARKLCGVKLQRTSVVGKSAKVQTFEHMIAHDLKDVVFSKKKSGAPADCAYDMCDAYVVARGFSLSEQFLNAKVD